MTLKQMFWTLYIAGLVCILLCTGVNLIPMGIFVLVGAFVWGMTLAGGTHNP